MLSIKNILIVLVFVVCACEKNVTTIDIGEKPRKLVLHSFIGPGDEIVSNLSFSKSSLSSSYIHYAENGAVDIFDADELVLSLEHDTVGFYYSQENNLEPLKEYTIKAHVTDYPDVTCNFVIPQKVAIESVDSTVTTVIETWDGGETEERKDYSIHVKFNDPQGENYYIIRFYRNALMFKYDSETSEPVGVLYDKQYISMQSDDISAELGIHDERIEMKYDEGVYGTRGICFSDEFFSGKTKTFTFDVSHYELPSVENIAETYYIQLENISKDYYLFLKSYALYQDAEFDLFAQKVNVYNNVEGGFGIIGTYSQTLDSILISN